MAVFGKVSDCLAPRDAIDNDFTRWLTKHKGTHKATPRYRCRGIA